MLTNTGPKNLIEMAINFTFATNMLLPDLAETCRAVFNLTLEYHPTKRLPRGWHELRAILGQHG